MQKRPLLALLALTAATEPDLGRGALERLKGGLRDRYAADPIGSTMTTVLLASFLFYQAERGHNPKVKSIFDALTYVSTNLSVGYSDILATTPAGKSIGTVLMTFGPAMAAGILGEPNEAKQRDAQAQAIVDRLDRIVAALENRADPRSVEGLNGPEGADRLQEANRD